MKKALFAIPVLALAAALQSAAPAMAAGNTVRFDGGIGVHPVGGITTAGLPLRNDVLQVPPGGRPWVIARLKAEVKGDGRISARGEGLLLGGGDAIGTVGPVTAVVATLFCGGQAFHSDPAALDARGNFEIGGHLRVTPPSPCVNPVLLIRNGAGGIPGPWFAAGIPVVD